MAGYHHHLLPRPSLSDQQFTVAWMIFRGMSNREIAQALQISLQSVKNTVADIFERTDLWDRTQVAFWVAGHCGLDFEHPLETWQAQSLDCACL